MLEGGSDDEGASTEAQGRAIIEALGRDKRNEVLAALYMVRADVSLSVRQVMALMCLTFSFVLDYTNKDPPAPYSLTAIYFPFVKSIHLFSCLVI